MMQCRPQIASGSAVLWRGRVPPDLREAEALAASATADEWQDALRQASVGAEPQPMLAPTLEGLQARDAADGGALERWCAWDPASRPSLLLLAGGLACRLMHSCT